MKAKPLCDEIRPRLSGHHDGALPAPVAERVRAHLDGCDACREELEAIAGVARLMGETSLAPSPGFEARLAARLAARRVALERWSARARLARRLSLHAAALLLAALVGLGTALVRQAATTADPMSDDQILYLALVENGPASQEDAR